MTKEQRRKKANNLLAKVPMGPLQEWINAAANIEGFESALEGIYCGRDGSINVKLSHPFEGLYLTMGWHTVSTTPRVEYAYVS